MFFSSFLFLFWFLPAALLLYFGLAPLLSRIFCGGDLAARCRVQNGMLLFLGIFFYAFSAPRYLFLLLGTALFDYLVGLRLAVSRKRRALFFTALTVQLFPLLFFKYAPTVARLAGGYLAALILPLGISFYTFSAISYLADVAFRDLAPEKNPLNLFLYLTMPFQIASGPITRYGTLAPQFSARNTDEEKIAAGARRFLAGLAKKLLLANPMGTLFTTLVGGSAALAALDAWLGLLAFSLQIYFDFSGYTDMALGLAAVFGFSLPENFNYPYTATSFTDFWRRWHITLSSFFRDYVYFPLGGSRVGAWRLAFNLFAVWCLTGLWHGSTLNFLLWGLYYFLGLLLEKRVLRRYLEKLPSWIRRTLTLLGVAFGWLIFAFDGSTPARSLAAVGSFLSSLLFLNGTCSAGSLYQLFRHLPLLLFCCLGATPLPHRLWQRAASGGKASKGVALLLLPLFAFFLSLFYLSSATFTSFLYFRF